MRRPAHDAPGDGAVHTGPDPYAAIHPQAVGLIETRLLTVGRGLPALGSGDARPPTLRPGSLDASRLPSRMGQLLVYPDGRRWAADDAPAPHWRPGPYPNQGHPR